MKKLILQFQILFLKIGAGLLSIFDNKEKK